MSNQRLGEKIRALLRQNNRTQVELADAIGLDTPQVSRIVNGRSGTTTATLLKIARFLNVPSVELLSLLDDVEIDMEDPMLSRIISLYSSWDNENDKEMFVQMAELITRRMRKRQTGELQPHGNENGSNTGD
jgi:transcriptional regulator with XRE-family HTH domain